MRFAIVCRDTADRAGVEAFMAAGPFHHAGIFEAVGIRPAPKSLPKA